jgi:hypothetical protein
MEFTPLIALALYVMLKLASATETGLHVSVTINDKACTYAISIINSGDSPIYYVDGLNQYAITSEIPLATVLQFKSSTHLSQDTVERLSKGYSFAAEQSEAISLPCRLSKLRPGEKIAKEFSLKHISVGVLKGLSATRAALAASNLRIRVSVFLDASLERCIEAESAWIPCPKCVLTQG